MEIRNERQLNPVADEVSAITAVVRPILLGILYSLKADVVEEAGGREGVKLKMLRRASVGSGVLISSSVTQTPTPGWAPLSRSTHRG